MAELLYFGIHISGSCFRLALKKERNRRVETFIAENIKGILAVKREIKMRLYYSLF